MPDEERGLGGNDEDKKGRVNKLFFFSHQPSAIVSLWEKEKGVNL